MEEKEIKQRINEVEEKLKVVELTLANYDFYDRLLDIHKKLWDLLYFKKNQEENFLLK